MENMRPSDALRVAHCPLVRKYRLDNSIANILQRRIDKVWPIVLHVPALKNLDLLIQVQNK